MYKVPGRKGFEELPIPWQDVDRPALVQALCSTCEFSNATASQGLVVSIPHHTPRLPALTFLPTASVILAGLYGEGELCRCPMSFWAFSSCLFSHSNSCVSEFTAGCFKERLFWPKPTMPLIHWCKQRGQFDSHVMYSQQNRSSLLTRDYHVPSHELLAGFLVPDVNPLLWSQASSPIRKHIGYSPDRLAV